MEIFQLFYQDNCDVKATQWRGDNLEEVRAFASEAGVTLADPYEGNLLLGNHEVRASDYIINFRGVLHRLTEESFNTLKDWAKINVAK